MKDALGEEITTNEESWVKEIDAQFGGDNQYFLLQGKIDPDKPDSVLFRVLSNMTLEARVNAVLTTLEETMSDEEFDSMVRMLAARQLLKMRVPKPGQKGN